MHIDTLGIKPMPLPPGVLSVDLVVCERILKEADNVPSAIRMIDIIRVLESAFASPNPTLVFSAMVFVRGDIGSTGDFTCSMVLSDPDATEIGIAQQTVSLAPLIEGAPGGAVVLAQFAVLLRYGTFRLRAFLADELQAQTTITVICVPE